MHHVQDLEVDPRDRVVRRAGVAVRLSRKEHQLLLALISRAGEVVTREQLMREVWGATCWTSTKTIDVHLGWLRRKLGDDPRRPTLITTLRGRGLRLETEPETEAPAVAVIHPAAAGTGAGAPEPC